MEGEFEFRLIRFNPRRAMRHAPAAEVLVSSEGIPDEAIWMDEKDIARNIREFGNHPELLKAQEHYRTRREFPARA